jgi:hypothetical protein
MIDLGFSKLVRYEQDGKVFFGDLQSHSDDGKYIVKRLEGDLDQGFRSAGDENIAVSKASTWNVLQR